MEALQGEGPFTVFAPTDAAFELLPEGTVEALLEDPQGLLTDILLYHVVGAQALSTDLSDGMAITTLNGEEVTVSITEEGVFINGAQVILPDLMAGNGVVHVIDAVLIPTGDETPETVVDIIVGSEVHTTLAAAVTAAGLVEALQGEGPFTVFAPTDAAFELLPEGTVEALLEDPQGLLTDILLYHVVGAQALSTDLSDGMAITTLNGEEVTVSITEEGVFINGAQVILPDLMAGNGVVHVIDAVLIPTEDPTTNVFEPVAGSGLFVNVYPNPAQNFFQVAFDMRNAGQVQMEVISMIGTRMAYRDMGVLPAGSHVYSSSVDGLFPGLYFVVIQSGNERQVTRLQVVN